MKFFLSDLFSDFEFILKGSFHNITQEKFKQKILENGGSVRKHFLKVRKMKKKKKNQKKSKKKKKNRISIGPAKPCYCPKIYY